MKGLLLIVLLISVFTPLVFAEEADVCQSCQDACYAIAESGACRLMDSDDDRATFAGMCAFQCKVVYSRERRCPSAQETWDGVCGNMPASSAPEDWGTGPCAGVECRDYCVGDISYRDGGCVLATGDCKYNTNIECESGCDERTGRCIGEGSQPDEPGNKCEGVPCGNYCEGKISYYGGECDRSSGECMYFSEECEFACNPYTGRCEKNTDPPEIILETTPSSVVVSGKEEIDIMVQLVRGSGEAVEGADVYIRVSDPEFTGLLGDWGFLDVKKSTDGGGIASATLGLPSMKSIDRMHYGEFPLELEIEITAAKHSGGEDWSTKKNRDYPG
jgi:hypothetical protein